MANKKRTYTADFRSDAVRLVLEHDRSVADVAKSLDVHVNTLHGWVRDAREHGSPGKRRSAEQDEILRLRRELRRVTEERDILKKAAAYFANPRRSGSPS